MWSSVTSTLAVAAYLLRIGIGNIALADKRTSHSWSLGYGGVGLETMVRSGHDSGKLIPTILLANLPQALLSFLYLTYNALFISMLLAEEWSDPKPRSSLTVTGY